MTHVGQEGCFGLSCVLCCFFRFDEISLKLLVLLQLLLLFLQLRLLLLVLLLLLRQLRL